MRSEVKGKMHPTSNFWQTYKIPKISNAASSAAAAADNLVTSQPPVLRRSIRIDSQRQMALIMSREQRANTRHLQKELMIKQNETAGPSSCFSYSNKPIVESQTPGVNTKQYLSRDPRLKSRSYSIDERSKQNEMEHFKKRIIYEHIQKPHTVSRGDYYKNEEGKQELSKKTQNQDNQAKNVTGPSTSVEKKKEVRLERRKSMCQFNELNSKRLLRRRLSCPGSEKDDVEKLSEEIIHVLKKNVAETNVMDRVSEGCLGRHNLPTIISSEDLRKNQKHVNEKSSDKKSEDKFEKNTEKKNESSENRPRSPIKPIFIKYKRIVDLKDNSKKIESTDKNKTVIITLEKHEEYTLKNSRESSSNSVKHHHASKHKISKSHDSSSNKNRDSSVTNSESQEPSVNRSKSPKLSVTSSKNQEPSDKSSKNRKHGGSHSKKQEPSDNMTKNRELSEPNIKKRKEHKKSRESSKDENQPIEKYVSKKVTAPISCPSTDGYQNNITISALTTLDKSVSCPQNIDIVPPNSSNTSEIDEQYLDSLISLVKSSMQPVLFVEMMSVLKYYYTELKRNLQCQLPHYVKIKIENTIKEILHYIEEHIFGTVDHEEMKVYTKALLEAEIKHFQTFVAAHFDVLCKKSKDKAWMVNFMKTLCPDKYLDLLRRNQDDDDVVFVGQTTLMTQDNIAEKTATKDFLNVNTSARALDSLQQYRKNTVPVSAQSTSLEVQRAPKRLASVSQSSDKLKSQTTKDQEEGTQRRKRQNHSELHGEAAKQTSIPQLQNSQEVLNDDLPTLTHVGQLVGRNPYGYGSSLKAMGGRCDPNNLTKPYGKTVANTHTQNSLASNSISYGTLRENISARRAYQESISSANSAAAQNIPSQSGYRMDVGNSLIHVQENQKIEVPNLHSNSQICAPAYAPNDYASLSYTKKNKQASNVPYNVDGSTSTLAHNVTAQNAAAPRGYQINVGDSHMNRHIDQGTISSEQNTSARNTFAQNAFSAQNVSAQNAFSAQNVSAQNAFMQNVSVHKAFSAQDDFGKKNYFGQNVSAQKGFSGQNVSVQNAIASNLRERAKGVVDFRLHRQIQSFIPEDIEPINQRIGPEYVQCVDHSTVLNSEDVREVTRSPNEYSNRNVFDVYNIDDKKKVLGALELQKRFEDMRRQLEIIETTHPDLYEETRKKAENNGSRPVTIIIDDDDETGDFQV